jgi:hypothetical protein
MQVCTIVFEGINANVPLAERVVDARDFSPLAGILAKMRDPMSGRGERAKPALNTVPWKQKLATAARVLISQTPAHNPAKEPLPKFADRWLQRYNDGDDVCHWYSSQLAT